MITSPLMDKETALNLLSSVQSTNTEIRGQAEGRIKEFMNLNFQKFLEIFGGILFEQETPLATRNICSIIMKNSVHSRNIHIQQRNEKNWKSCNEVFKKNFINFLQSHLNSKEKPILLNISKILGSILRIEIYNGCSPEILNYFVEMIQKQEYAVGIHKTISYAYSGLIDETNYDILKYPEMNLQAFKISTFYLNSQNVPDEIKTSSFLCILNTLEIFSEFVSTGDQILSFFSKIVSVDQNNIELFEISLEILDRSIFALQHIKKKEIEYLCSYFDSIFRDTDPCVQIFNFWSDLLESEHKNIIESFKESLVSKLLNCITKEDINSTELTSHKDSCNLLITLRNDKDIAWNFSTTMKNFIDAKLSSESLQDNAIGCISLGCIYSSEAHTFVEEKKSRLLSFLDSPGVANEALFAFSIIVEKGDVTNYEMLLTIIKNCRRLIDLDPKLYCPATWTLLSCITYLNTVCDNKDSIISTVYTDLLTTLMKKLTELSPQEYSVRNALVSTLVELMPLCPVGEIGIMDHLQRFIFSKIMEITKAIRASSYDHVLTLDDTLCGYVILLNANLNAQKNADCDSLCAVLGEIIILPDILARGEVYILVSKNLSRLSIYLKKFLPFIAKDLMSKEVFLMKSALNLLSECAIVLQSVFDGFVSLVIPALINALSSNDVPLDIKPLILSTMADIALAVGKSFSSYIEMSVVFFKHIIKLDRTGDEEIIDSIKKAAISLFDSLLVSVGPTEAMMANLPEILNSIHLTIYSDKTGLYKHEILDIIGDLQVFSRKNNYEFNRTVIYEYVLNCLKIDDMAFKKKSLQVLELFK